MLKKTILRLIRLYQKTSFLHGYFFRMFYMTDKICRFSPTCSEYTYEAIDRYGVGIGLFLGFKRILRCHPWNKGGFDPVKPR